MLSAGKATWQSHADPRERLYGAEVTRVQYLYIFILHMVIVHISIPFIGTHYPLKPLHLINPIVPFYFLRVGLILS